MTLVDRLRFHWTGPSGQPTASRAILPAVVPGPGRYHLVAYARGVGGEAYVTAGYTGQSPSCGLPLAELSLDANAHLSGIVIADWNWACAGDAYRPEKPAEVPLP